MVSYSGLSTMTNETVIATLNKLIEVCLDGYEGYMQAADGAELKAFKVLLMDYAQQREQFAVELVNLVVARGGEVVWSNNAASALRLGWEKIGAATSLGNDNYILAECEQGEIAAIQAYTNALEKELPKNVAYAVLSQYEYILQAYDHIHELRASYTTHTTSSDLFAHELVTIR